MTAVEVHVHRDPPAVAGRRDQMGVLLLILADIAFVLSLMFSYLYLRFLNVNGRWLPEEITPVAPGTTWVVNVLLIVGAVILALGFRSLRPGRAGGFVASAGLALVIALAALVLQWWQLATFGFPSAENGYFSSAYSSVMVTLAGANIFHILLAVIVTLGLFARGLRGMYRDGEPWQPRLGVYWWTWVAISAVLVGLMTTFLVASPSPPSLPIG